MDDTVVLGKQGRIVIPAEVRLALGLKAGDRLHLSTADRRLLIEPQEDAVKELQRIGDAVPRARSLVEELLEERRIEARRG